MLSLPAAIESAISSIRSSFLRSILTMLGIVIGITSVIVMNSFGTGLQDLVLKQLKTYDDTLIMVVAQAPAKAGQTLSQPGSLRDSDLSTLSRAVPEVDQVGAQVREAVKLTKEDRHYNSVVLGIDESFFEMSKWHIADGRPLEKSEIASGAKVVLLGATVRDKLFGDRQAVGEKIRVNGTPMVVAGVLESKGAGVGMDQDDIVLAPLNAVRRRIFGDFASDLTSDSLQAVWVTFKSRGDTAERIEAIERVLDRRHTVSDDRSRPYTVISMTEQLRNYQKAFGAFSIALAGIASISLIVGGIGIMNIMLVNVSERKREIGLRMAIGASSSAIRRQFLTEAAIMCVIAGMVGVLAGCAIVLGLQSALPEWPISIACDSVLLGLGVSCATGVLFGILPAIKASRLPPVAALRYE